MVRSETASILALAAVLVLGLATVATRARAEPLLLTVEGSGALALSEPQTSLFGPGLTLAVGGLVPIAPQLLVGGRLRAGVLLEGDPPANARRDDPGAGGLTTLSALLRVRPLASGDDVRRGTGMFLELGGGGVLTGELVRAGFEGGIGWGFATGSLAIAPTLKYAQVVDPDHELEDRDARLLLFGAEVVWFDARPRPRQHEPEAADRDGDGIVDRQDGCPRQPEDFDGFEDEDGCPEADNDGDGIADDADECPLRPEDFDEFEDQDGCPDPDNDEDGVLDADDKCPTEPETINGNEDEDGCPDEGLIEMVGDRIVLEERVMFDFERARIKRRARRMLRAIVNLWKQHPEWTKLRVEGHADRRGVEEFNQRLSERRARNVVRALVKMGIPQDIIDYVGYGSSRPRDRRNTKAAYRRNRRVEFVVIERHSDEPQPSEPENEREDARPWMKEEPL